MRRGAAIALSLAIGYASATVVTPSELRRSFNKATNYIKQQVHTVTSPNKKAKKKHVEQQNNQGMIDKAVESFYDGDTSENKVQEDKNKHIIEKKNIIKFDYSKGGNKASFDY